MCWWSATHGSFAVVASSLPLTVRRSGLLFLVAIASRGPHDCCAAPILIARESSEGQAPRHVPLFLRVEFGLVGHGSTLSLRLILLGGMVHRLDAHLTGCDEPLTGMAVQDGPFCI